MIIDKKAKIRDYFDFCFFYVNKNLKYGNLCDNIRMMTKFM